jgi:hypothetical protein
MRLRISNSGDDGRGNFGDWFVVKPLEGNTTKVASGATLTHDMAVMSLLSYGRDVWTIDTDQMTVTKEELTP